MQRLADAHIAVFGVGGVGSFAAEALARSGVGHLTIIDFDDIDITNVNRQLPALLSTVGHKKVDVLAERLQDINPELELTIIGEPYLPEQSDRFFAHPYDYIVDAIDMITSKIHLIQTAKAQSIPIISSMGMGNKIDPTRITVCDLAKTHTCPLARVMRRELKQRGIDHLTVVYSDEPPRKPAQSIQTESKREIPASCAFVPSVAGLVMASYVIRDLADVL